MRFSSVFFMQALLVLVRSLGAGAPAARAECGDEAWVVEPEQIAVEALKGAKYVLTLRVSTGTARLASYSPGWEDFLPAEPVAVERFVGVSRAPSCDPARHPLDGVRFPVLERRGDYAFIVSDAGSGETLWIRPKDADAHSWIDLENVPSSPSFNVRLRERGPIPVFFEPEETDVYLYLPPKYGVLRVLEQREEFLRLGAGRGRGALGWIRSRRDDGELLVWPWHQDDC